MDDISPNFPEDHVQHHKHPNSRDHVPECRDRRNHYLDLAGVESPKHNNLSHLKANHESSGSPRAVPKYACSYRIRDRTHTCSKAHHIRDNNPSPSKKPSMSCHPKLNIDIESSPRMYRTKIEPDDDLLNLNFDMIDLMPEPKFDCEKPHHRRSKSYDLYENEFNSPGGLYSPKLKPRNNQNWTSVLESPKLSNHLPSSPGHRNRQRHKDREHQRAMQQVANWIAREHSNSKSSDATKRFIYNSVVPNSHRQIAERHEHHHLHEHVHHHYHHFVEF